VIADLAAVIADRPGAFDLMLLDVDNGPGWLASTGNAGLYTIDGVAAGRRALRPGGVLAVWSPKPNPDFEAVLRSVFPTVAIETTRSPTEPPSTIYLGCDSASSSS
jgi:spermidine synthase